MIVNVLLSRSCRKWWIQALFLIEPTIQALRDFLIGGQCLDCSAAERV